jgi:hypothetical protein
MKFLIDRIPTIMPYSEILRVWPDYGQRPKECRGSKFRVSVFFYLPHMEYEGSIGFVMRKMKKILLLIFTF